MGILGSQPDSRLCFSFFLFPAPSSSLKTCLESLLLFKVVSSNKGLRVRTNPGLQFGQWRRLKQRNKLLVVGKLGGGEGRGEQWMTGHFWGNIFSLKRHWRLSSRQENQSHIHFEKTIYFFPNIIPNVCFTGHYGSETFYRRNHFDRLCKQF